MKTINQVLLALLFAAFSTVGMAQTSQIPSSSLIKLLDFDKDGDDDDDDDDDDDMETGVYAFYERSSNNGTNESQTFVLIEDFYGKMND